MDAFADRLDRFGADALERVGEGIKQLRVAVLDHLAHVEQLHKASLEQLSREVEACGPRHQARAPPPPALAPPVPGSFGALLLEPTVAVRLGGETLHVHAALLRRSPFFAALLKGAWRDAAGPALELPCSTFEFCLLLQRLYTGEPLGTPSLPVEDFSAALRIAKAASMLLIEDQLPELPSVLRASMIGAGDVEEARAIGVDLPPVLGDLLTELENTAGLAAVCAAEGVATVRTAAAREALAAVLTARRRQLDSQLVAASAGEVLRQATSPEDVAWAARVAREHLAPVAATAIFMEAPKRETHSCIGCSCYDPFEDCEAALRVAFAEHLQRCAEAGVLEEAFACGVDDGSSSPSTHLVYTSGFDHANTCIIKFRSRLLFDESSASMLVSVLRKAPRELCAAVRCLTRMCPSQLAEVLTTELLAAVSAFAEPLVEQLATDPVSAARWASVEHLAALPAAPRRAMGAVLLRSMELLEPDVAAAIGKELASC